jgi:hypothetical protein
MPGARQGVQGQGPTRPRAGAPGRQRHRCSHAAGIRSDPSRRTVTRDGEHGPLSHEASQYWPSSWARTGGVVSAEQLVQRPGTKAFVRSPVTLLYFGHSLDESLFRPDGAAVQRTSV